MLILRYVCDVCIVLVEFISRGGLLILKIGSGQSNFNQNGECLYEAKEALWMLEDGTAGGKGQRKKR
nr:unnamed protein product [Callosobruchus analis]